jgi:long-chain acyl-CoA synthetase
MALSAAQEAEILARLTGPGAPFEIVVEPVLGEPMSVFRERPRSLREVLAASAGLGEAEYLVWGEERISFAAHVRRVAAVAKALRERFGVRPGDRVALFAANRPEWIVSFWAATSLGAIAVGLNGWWVAEEARFALGDCEPALLIGDRKRLARLSGVSLSMPVVEMESEFASLLEHGAGADLPDAPIDEDQPATILYTSGTTGRPKGAVNTHRNIVGLVRAQILHGARAALVAAAQGAEVRSSPTGRCALVTTPLFHVSGLYSGVVTFLATGVKTVWSVGRFDPGAVLALIEREQVTTWGPTGTMLHRVLEHPDLRSRDLGSLTHVGSGGAPVPPSLQERMRKAFPNARASMGVGYGLTESSALVTLNSGEELERHPDSVGRPIPTMEVEIRREGRAVGEGEEGEIHVRGPLVMKEYWRRPEETAATILPGRWLRTGDVGHLADGRLYLHTRRRDLILRGGENVYPAEIELCLEEHPEVQEAAVVGVDDPDLGQRVRAVVVPRPGARPSPESLRAWVADRLAYFKVPAEWELRTEALPRNASGKVMKHLLEAPDDNPFVDD